MNNNEYTNETAIENYLLIDIDASLSSTVTEWIKAISNYIDSYCGRPEGFDSGAATVQYYDGTGISEIKIENNTEVTAVEIIEVNGTDTEYTLTEGENNDYITYPYNRLPIYKLIMTANSQVGAFLSGRKRIKITAKWGQSVSVPLEIKLAATQMVSAMAVEKGLHGGPLEAEALGDYSVKYGDADKAAQASGISVLKMLDKYKKFEIG